MKYSKMNIFETENLYFLGPKGTYAQLAMNKFVADLDIKAKNIIPLNPITKIIQAVDADKNAIAILPIENSIEGIVRETIDNFVKLKDKNLKIAAETIIPISHCLMSKATDIKEIKHVVSYTQALGQCSTYICNRIPNATIIEATSTSDAARLLQEKDNTYAAIASEAAAEI